MKRPVYFLVFAAVMVAIGLAGGYYAARQTAEDAKEDEHEHEPEFPPELRARLGIELRKVQPTQPVIFRRIHGVLTRDPASRRNVSSPFGGVVRELHVREGGLVSPGQPIVTIVRDALPRPNLTWAGDLLRPVNEELHLAYGHTVLAAKRLELARAELARQQRIADKGAGDLPLVSKQRLVELRYKVDEARAALRVAEAKLEAHGLSEDEIRVVASGGHPPLGHELWRRALTHHGLWPTHAQEILASLEEAQQKSPLTIAFLGELAAAGLCSGELVSAISDSADMRANVIDVAALLLTGHTLPWLVDVTRRGGLGAMMRLRVPKSEKTAAFDLTKWRVEPGQHVSAGQTIAVLDNPAALRLELQPTGDEHRVVRRACVDAVSFRASPVLPVSNTPLAVELKISRVVATEDGRSRAYASIPNAVESTTSGRLWQWFPGQRVVAKIPSPIGEEPAVVLPRAAVIKRGAEWIALVYDDLFIDPKPVHVVYEDQDSVVLKPGSLASGTTVVVKGALAALLMIESPGGGHDHPHDH